MRAFELAEAVWNRLRSANGLTYAPEGWRTRLPQSNARCGFAQGENLDSERRAVEALARQVLTGREPREGWSSVDVRLRQAYGRALAAAVHGKDSLRILDYGGALGYAYWETKLLLPRTSIEFHCKELADMAHEGRRLIPAAVWHSDDRCLDQAYDLVRFSASLQYIEDWPGLLRRAARAARPYLFLTRTTVVERVPSYVAVQRLEGAYFLHQQINTGELFQVLKGCGLALEEEFLDLEPHMRVRGAPEQPAYRSWLFKRGRDA